MKTSAYLLLGLLAASALGACSKKDDSASPTSGGDYLDFTYNGKTYHSTLYASAIQDSDTSLALIGSSDDLNTIVNMKVPLIYKKGPGTYSFPKTNSIPLTPLPVAALTLDSKSQTNATQYSTYNGPSANNGSVVITSYDRTGQKVAGTFSFTAGPVFGGAGTMQTVTSGKFSFTTFH